MTGLHLIVLLEETTVIIYGLECFIITNVIDSCM